MDNNKRRTVSDTGKTVGELLVGGLQEFARDLAKDKKGISKSYTCHKVKLDLRPAKYNTELVKKTREILGTSQTVFAQFIGVSPQAVQAWEQGQNTPSNMACRLMDEIRHNPKYWKTRLRQLAVKKNGKAKGRVAG